MAVMEFQYAFQSCAQRQSQNLYISFLLIVLFFLSFSKRKEKGKCHKKGDKQIIDNYRPVSILSICSKIFEKIIEYVLNTF